MARLPEAGDLGGMLFVLLLTYLAAAPCTGAGYRRALLAGETHRLHWQHQGTSKQASWFLLGYSLMRRPSSSMGLSSGSVRLVAIYPEGDGCGL